MSNRSMKKNLLGKIFSNSSHFFSARLIETISNFLLGYAGAILLGPKIYGIWQTAKVVLNYRSVAGLSLTFVMRRDYASLISSNKEDEALELKGMVLAYFCFIMPLCALCISLYAFFVVDTIWFRYSLLVIASFYLFDVVISVSDMLLKSLNRYKTISKVAYIQAFGNILIIPAMYYWGMKGVLIGFFSVGVSITGYYLRNFPGRFLIRWNYPLFKKNLIVALPIYLQHITFHIFNSIDRILLASLISFEAVGLYSLTALIANPVTILLKSFSTVIFTQLNEDHYGDMSSEVIEKYFRLPQAFFAYVLPVIIAIGIILLPPFVDLFLKSYTEGVLAAQIYCFGLLFNLLAEFSSNALFIMNKQKVTASSFFIVGIFNLIGTFVLIKAGMSLAGAAIATSLGFLGYHGLLLYSIDRYSKISYGGFIRHYLKTTLPSVIIFIGLILLPHLFSFWTPMISWVYTLLFSIFFTYKAYQVYKHLKVDFNE